VGIKLSSLNNSSSSDRKEKILQVTKSPSVCKVKVEKKRKWSIHLQDESKIVTMHIKIVTSSFPFQLVAAQPWLSRFILGLGIFVELHILHGFSFIYHSHG
jgi:hypothetical protein